MKNPEAVEMIHSVISAMREQSTRSLVLRAYRDENLLEVKTLSGMLQAYDAVEENMLGWLKDREDS